MSKLLLTNITCDGCGKEFDKENEYLGRKIGTIRTEAKRQGWRYYNIHGGTPKDHCPKCGPIRRTK